MVKQSFAEFRHRWSQWSRNGNGQIRNSVCTMQVHSVSARANENYKLMLNFVIFEFLFEVLYRCVAMSDTDICFAARVRKRIFCPHCEENVSHTTYYHHCQRWAL